MAVPAQAERNAGRPDEHVDLPRALRDAGVTALIAFGLFLPQPIASVAALFRQG